ncbi:MAG: hypothetical protein JW839_09420 [Candidatus Lokiarchaeota archaeon]|nr:hypothetical protein [Candidatus Lokiarchaeota archaeon]
MSGVLNFPTTISNQPDARASPSGTISPSNEFNGVGDALRGVATARYQKNQAGVGATNTTTTDVPLFIDDTHGWKGTQVSGNVTNIKDTRDWVSGGSYLDSSLTALDSTATRVNYNYWYPSNTTYFPNQNMSTSRQVISIENARAIRIHFQQITLSSPQDSVRVTNMEDTITYFSSTATQSNVYTNWIELSQVYVGYTSNANGESIDGYIIDHILYVPANETISTLVESPHPYPANKAPNPGWILQSSIPARRYMRAHFSLLDIEAEGWDYLQLYNNLSSLYYTYDTPYGTRKIETRDRWTPWTATDKISFNLTSDASYQYDGFIVDKYQLSTTDPAQFASRALQMNVDIRWHNYEVNHPISLDQLVLQQASARYMRINFTHVNFEDGSDYLVLLDNNSRFLMDFTGDHRNVLTPWFYTNRITIAYVSDGTNVAEMPAGLGARITYYEYSTASLNLNPRIYAWNNESNYYTTPGRASGYPAIRNGELGLALQIDGIDGHGTSSYEYMRFSYEQSDLSEFNQLISVPRGAISDAYFSLDYYPEKVMGSNDFELYVAINDTIIFSRGFLTMGQNPRVWQSTGNIGMALWSNTSALFSNMDVDAVLKFQVGIRFNQPTSISFSYFKDSDRQLVIVDDIKLVLMTAANATQVGIDLRANGTAMTSATTGPWGRASFQLTGDWLENPLNVAFTTASPSISFDVDMILDVETSITSTWAQTFSSNGSSYVVQPDENASWSWYENVYIPPGYTGYALNVSKPASRVIDSIMDPTGTDVLFAGGTEGVRWFSFATAFPGWYSVSAHSRNYFDPALLSDDNATWSSSLSIVNQQQAYISTPFRVPLSLPSGNGTLLLRTPTGVTWLSQPFVVAKTTNVSQGPFTFGPSNSTGGVYSGFSAWENGTEVGFRGFSITSTHASRLEISYPVDARIDNTTSQLVDSIVPIRIVYNDTFSAALIPGASITGSLNSTPVSNFLFTESTPGIYDHALDTTGLPEGNYMLEISASKAGYIPVARNISIILDVDTRVDGFTSFQQVQHGFNASISFHYHDVVRDLGVTGATIQVSFSGADYAIVDLSGGDYAISLNTTSFGLGTHPFSVTVQKPFHETTVLSGAFSVVRMLSHLEVSNGTLSGYVGHPAGPYQVSFYHPDYPATIRFDGAEFTVYLDSGMTTKLDPTNYTVAEMGGGRYTITIMTGMSTPIATPGIKVLYLVAGNSSSYPFYLANSTGSLNFILNARPVTHSLLVNSTNITSEASFSVGIQEDFVLNMTVMDVLSGGWATGYAFAYNFSNGHSGTFSPQGDSYIALVSHTDLSGGYFTLRISGSSVLHDALQVQYVVSVQVITTYVEGFVNYQLREHGTNATIAFHYHDAIHDTGIPGATVVVDVAGIGVLNPSDYELVEGPGGNYTVSINTTLFSLGTRSFTVTASLSYHQAQAMSGTVEIVPRLSTLAVLNASISGFIADEVGPIALRYYHPDHPETLNYTQVLFMVSINPSFTQLVDPAGYAIVPVPDGSFSLSLRTGPATSFTTAGLKTLYIRASNSSASAIHVANATTVFSFILSLRPLAASIHLNGVNVTSTSTISASIGQPLIMNVTLTDGVNGSVPLISLTYDITNGPSGSFLLLSGNYTSNLMAGNFTTGVQTLSIASGSSIYALFSRVYLITIIPRAFSLDLRVNGSLVSENGLVSIVSGTCIELEANYTDAITYNPLFGGRVNVTLDGVPFSSFTVNATSAKVILGTCAFLPGFHSVSVLATLSNYSAEYIAFTLEIKRRVLRSSVSFDGMPWDGVSPVSAQLATMIEMNFTMIDNATGTPLAASNVTLSPPSVIGTYGISAYLENISLSFNTSAIGIGQEYLTFVIASPRYITFIVGLFIDVHPIPIHASIKDNQTYFEARPGGSLRIAIDLLDAAGLPVTGAVVSYSWLGTVGTLQDMNNGTYSGLLTMPTSEGIQSVAISARLDENHTVATTSFTIIVKQPQLSNEAITTNIIVAALILGVFFVLFFVLYLRPRIIKRRLVRFEDVKSCIVHKGPIKEGLTYVCPTCGSIYCTKCAQALFNNNDPCWSCATPIQPFAVSYKEDWRKNLQHVLIYQTGSSEPIYEQSLTTEDVTMPEMLTILKKSITRHVSKPAKKASVIDVQEYFNSKILFGRGDFITLVLVSRIDSSFIHEKMKEFVENWELGFYDREAGTWKVDARAKYATKTRFMVDAMFVKEEGVKEEPKKGKDKGAYVNPDDLVHKAHKPSLDQHKDRLPVPPAGPPNQQEADQATFIPIAYPERPESRSLGVEPEKPSRPDFDAAEEIKQFLDLSPPEPEPASKPGAGGDGVKQGEAGEKPPDGKREDGEPAGE